MKFLQRILLFVVFAVVTPIDFFLGTAEVFAFMIKDQVTYLVTPDDKNIVVLWNPVEGATYYEVKLISFEKGREVTLADSKTAARNKIIELPHEGHFVVRIRACDHNRQTDRCSPWSESTNPEVATVDGEPKGWWFYRYNEPPHALEPRDNP